MKITNQLIFIYIILVHSLLCSCRKDEPILTTNASRTILVYMVAGNSLGTGNYDTADINEMIAASAADSFNNGRLIIYHAPYGNKPYLMEVKNGQIEILREYNQSLPSVTQERMQQVIDDTKRLAPANDYGLILWSHANGWLQNGIAEKFKSNNIKHLKHDSSHLLSFGEDKGKSMNITTLNEVIKDEEFSFIYFDCCYMASIEVIYELRHATPYIIASAPEVPANGMPYEYNLPLLFKEIPDLKGACINTFDYYNCAKGSQRSCAISLLETKHIEELAKATAAIYEQQPTLPEGFTPQKYTLDSNCYYFDFGQYIEALSSSYPTLLNNWHKAFNKVVTYKVATPYMWDKLKIEYHSGLSTYILDSPEYSAIKNYNQLQWWNDVANKLWFNN